MINNGIILNKKEQNMIFHNIYILYFVLILLGDDKRTYGEKSVLMSFPHNWNENSLFHTKGI